MLMLIKLIETNCSFKYMIDYLDDVIRPLVLVLPKLKGHVKNFKAENNMLMSFCIGEYQKSMEHFGLKLEIQKMLN